MDTATKPAFKYYIVASLPPGDDDLAKVLFNHLSSIPVFSDHSPKITTFGAVKGASYSAARGAITKDDEIVLVIDGYASQYTNSLQDIRSAMQDFLAGWNAFKALANRKEEAAANLAAEKARIKAEKKQLKVGDHVMIKGNPTATYVVTNVGYGEVRIHYPHVPHGAGGWYPTSELKKVKAPK